MVAVIYRGPRNIAMKSVSVYVSLSFYLNANYTLNQY